MGVCRSCNVPLSDEEAVRKYDNWEKIPKVNDRYIELCNKCYSLSGLDEEFHIEYLEGDEEYYEFCTDCEE